MTTVTTLCVVVLLSLLLFAPAPINAQTADLAHHDHMIAVIDQYTSKSQMILIDPFARISSPLLVPQPIDSFRVNRLGQIIYTDNEDWEGQYYVIDAHDPIQAPVAFDDLIGTHGHPVAWKGDDHPLTYVVRDTPESADRLFILGTDGTPVEITPQGLDPLPIGMYAGGVWSTDGRLAFSYFLANSSSNTAFPTELYLWDGVRTVNLSQNPYGSEGRITWSSNGRLAFQSTTRSDTDVLVWNGTYGTDGMPDPASFVNVAPELTGSYSELHWIDQGRLAFLGLKPGTRRETQIYAWDGEQVVNLSQMSGYSLRFTKWTADGRWAFRASRSSKERELLYVRDASNHTVMITAAYTIPAWSEDGILAFCLRQSGAWSLILWDGEIFWEAARGTSVDAQWESGESVSCSNG